MSEQDQTYYEMLWDCTTCNTKGLLSKSQRHCPMCGATQDPGKRYFPEAGKEVAAQGHQFVGADWHCAYCNSPNAKSAPHCCNCGAGQDGSKPVALVSETPPAPPEPPARPSRWKLWAGAAAVGLIVLLGMFFSTTDTTARIVARNWERSIQIERLVEVNDSAWCDSLPQGARNVTRTQEQRSTRKVEAGQECHDKRVDKGDGTFVKKQECVPKYHEEPVYDDRCHFRINRWQVARTLQATPKQSLAPVWPDTQMLRNQGHSLSAPGNEREGSRQERYSVTLSADGKEWQCDVPLPVWQKLRQGKSIQLKVRRTGGADCDSLSAAQ